ncbi:hypothetical protein [Pseudomonas sp. MWU12-2323]|uniref:hypothetical protein n=1 Tax=Pseudomonas sp. MWU12-2323 TaxID=2651296 RepID=UPI00128DA4B7|nr:hypothetical protein [Pseudomonas sp. MWU12-2323]MPQ69379.1 hypothetical protein [Pseudomonas sp. MWU12-2323]
MSNTVKSPQQRLIAWNVIFRLLTVAILTNVTAFLLYCFTSYKSAFQWVYGDGIWGAVAVQVVLTVLLSRAYHSAHYYYAMARIAEIEDELSKE